MPTRCFSTVRGKVVRVTQLDECGAVPEGAVFGVSEGFIQVVLSAEIESGDEFVTKNANGRLCINERSPDNLKRLNAVVDWCEVDPDLINLITGFPLELDGTSPGDDAVGFRIREGNADTNWALEVWTGLAGNQCGPDGQCFGYLLVPFITGATFGDITVANAAATYQTTGSYTQGHSGWDVGPWDVIGTPLLPTPLLEPIADDEHALLRVTCVPPPAAACGAVPVPPTSP